jgi:hypothetical protein
MLAAAVRLSRLSRRPFSEVTVRWGDGGDGERGGWERGEVRALSDRGRCPRLQVGGERWGDGEMGGEWISGLIVWGGIR